MRYLLILLLAFIGCGSPYRSLMHGGMVAQENFLETIPFEFDKGLPLIEVEIQGNKYKFLLDTGAPNVISQELSEIIKYEDGVVQNIGDSQGNKRGQQSIVIDNIKIGKIDFKNTGAIIIDYSGIFELNCFEIDGIIGANLMSKLIWEIDYTNKLLSFSDKKSNFNLPADAYLLPFNPHKNQRTPYVKIKTNQMLFENVTFDTGATGAISLSKNRNESIVNNLNGIEIHGNLSTGIYGTGEPAVSKYGVVDSLHLGNLSLAHQVVVFESKGIMTLGNKFLKHYRVVIDWGSEQIYLIKEDGYDNREYKSFGFIPKKKDDKLVVVGLNKESYAAIEGIELNTQILSIDEVDFRNVTDSLGCLLVTKEIFQNLDSLQVNFLHNGIEKSINVRKEYFIRSMQN